MRKDCSKTEPKRKDHTRINAICENCGTSYWEIRGSFLKKKRHFCSMSCYSSYRKFIPTEEQSNYQGIRQNGESKQIYHKRYVKKHPELIAHLKARRYAREKDAEGSHTLKDWEDLKNSFNNCCALCDSSEKVTKDHIIPLSKGGSDYIENIQPLCRSCNSKKSNKTD